MSRFLLQSDQPIATGAKQFIGERAVSGAEAITWS